MQPFFRDERYLNMPFRAVSVAAWQSGIKLVGSERSCSYRNSRWHLDMGQTDPGKDAAKHLKRKITMMSVSLTLIAATIIIMFVATSVASIVNSLRENHVDRLAAGRRMIF